MVCRAHSPVIGEDSPLTEELSLFNSNEFKNAKYSDEEFIKRCYLTFLDREPDKKIIATRVLAAGVLKPKEAFTFLKKYCIILKM